MKNIFNLLISCCLLFVGCATIAPVWKTIPETNYSYEKAWPIIVNSVSDKFDIETIDANSGYLRTTWKVKKDWTGTPDTRTRVVVRTETKNPLKFSFRAEVEGYNTFLEEWQAKGNDEKIESEMQMDFSSRFK